MASRRLLGRAAVGRQMAAKTALEGPGKLLGRSWRLLGQSWRLFRPILADLGQAGNQLNGLKHALTASGGRRILTARPHAAGPSSWRPCGSKVW